MTKGKHDLNPFARDTRGEWNGVVLYDIEEKQFFRYLDRNGKVKEPVSGKI